MPRNGGPGLALGCIPVDSLSSDMISGKTVKTHVSTMLSKLSLLEAKSVGHAGTVCVTRMDKICHLCSGEKATKRVFAVGAAHCRGHSRDPGGHCHALVLDRYAYLLPQFHYYYQQRDVLIIIGMKQASSS